MNINKQYIILIFYLFGNVVYCQENNVLVFNVQKPKRIPIVDIEYEFLLFNQPNYIKINKPQELDKYYVILDGGEVDKEDGFLILKPLVKDSVYLRLIKKDEHKKVAEHIETQIDKFKVIDKYLPFIGDEPIKVLEVDGLTEELISKEFVIKTKHEELINSFKVKSFKLSYGKDGSYKEHKISGNKIPKNLIEMMLKNRFNTYFVDNFKIEINNKLEAKVDVLGIIRADKLFHNIKSDE